MSVAPAVLRQIEEAVRSLRYGTVQITVHNARVVQIDKVERVRIDPAAADPASGRDTPNPQPAHRSSGSARPQGH
jgi:hypothetical protein